MIAAVALIDIKASVLRPSGILLIEPENDDNPCLFDGVETLGIEHKKGVGLTDTRTLNLTIWLVYWI